MFAHSDSDMTCNQAITAGRAGKQPTAPFSLSCKLQLFTHCGPGTPDPVALNPQLTSAVDGRALLMTF